MNLLAQENSKAEGKAKVDGKVDGKNVDDQANDQANDKSNEGLDPLFLRKQALSEDLARLANFEARLRQIDRKILYSLGLGGAQGAAIQSIALMGGTTTTTTMHSRLAVSKQSLHKSLGRLIAHGYIEQLGRDEKDQRRHIIALTKKGRELERLLGEQRAMALSKVYRAANAQQVEGFRRTLAQLNEGRISEARINEKSLDEMGLEDKQARI